MVAGAVTVAGAGIVLFMEDGVTVTAGVMEAGIIGMETGTTIIIIQEEIIMLTEEEEAMQIITLPEEIILAGF